MKAAVNTVPWRERPSWAFWLGCTEEAFDQHGLNLIRNERLDKAATVIVLAVPGAAFISIPAAGYEEYEAKLASLAGKHLITMVDVINALRADIRQTGYILWQGSLDPREFRPRVSEEVAQLRGPDLSTMTGLKEACHPTEWDHSCLTDSSDTTYGVRRDGNVVAAAHYVLLRPDLASIGVLTHPAHRGAGHAGAVSPLDCSGPEAGFPDVRPVHAAEAQPQTWRDLEPVRPISGSERPRMHQRLPA